MAPRCARWAVEAPIRIPQANDSHATELKLAIEQEHGGTAVFVKSVPVHESLRGRTVWNGSVQIFDLKDSPSGASRVYAWSHGLSDGTRRSVAVLHASPVTGPREAVRSALDFEQLYRK